MATHLDLDPDAVRGCCGSRRWGELMGAVLPVGSLSELLTGAERAFDALPAEDWLEAFADHAAIGAPRPGDARGAEEQAGAAGGDAEVRAALRSEGAAYAERFGFVFLIRARGRGAEEMLAALRERMDHSPEEEFAIAAAQQREITALRLGDLAAAAADPASSRP